MRLSVLLLALTALIASTVAFAATKSALPVDGYGVRIQGCAPTIKNGAALTVASKNVDVTGAVCWKAFTNSDAKFRLQSTATKVGTQHTLPGGSWYTEAVGDHKFVNWSGSVGTFRSDKP